MVAYKGSDRTFPTSNVLIYYFVVTKSCPWARWGEINPQGGVFVGGWGPDPTSVTQLTKLFCITLMT